MIKLARKRKDPRELYQEVLKEYNSEHFFTIDPGARQNGGTGMAYFVLKNKHHIASVIFSSKESTYDERVDEIVSSVIMSVRTYGNAPIFIEKPKFFDTGKGYVAAKSDSLGKLIYLYGRLCQACLMARSENGKIIPLEIAHWKGQLSKEQVKRRVMKARPKLDYSKISGDEIDAIGMGLYILGEI